MAGEMQQPTIGELFETFCYMTVEEFLIKKNMKATLSSFKTEYERPNEELGIISWYEVALKLHLPELINNGLKTASILENIVGALIKESSIKTRRPHDVTISGLASMPKVTSLPNIAEGTNSMNSPSRRPNSARRYDKEVQAAEAELQQIKHRIAAQEIKNNSVIKRHFDSNEVKQHISNKQIANSKLVSNENWIPADIRAKSLGRDLAVAKITYDDTHNLELGQQREMKRLNITDLDRAKFEESLKSTHKIPCSCCQKEFLYVNLPLKVSRKAIIDIRIKWSGSLSSATVFGELPPIEDSLENGGTGTLGNTAGSTAGGKKKNKSTTNVLGMVPRCYDEVGVCVFCAQFFHVQEDYRPSFQAITYQERKTQFFTNKRKEKEYWDPLEMIKKDRDMLESYQQTHMLNNTQNGVNGEMASVEPSVS